VGNRTLIKDGKILHTGGGAVAGITTDGRLIVDRLTFSFEGYVNGVFTEVKALYKQIHQFI